MNLEACNSEMSNIPSELTGPLPRKVQMSEGDARFALMLVWLFFVGGSLFLAWLCYDYVRQFQQRAGLRSDSREVVGEVTGFSYPRLAPMSIDYSFVVNGVIYSGAANKPATPRPGTSFDKHDQIRIKFLPSNPAINHPSGWEWSPAIGWITTAGSVFFWTVGVFSLALLLRDRKLARKGKVAAAVVTSCTRKDRRFDIKYEFCTGDGTPMKGKSDCADEYGSGARVWILYLPQKPRRNNMYPLSFFEVIE
jgi:hypothetical protein